MRVAITGHRPDAFLVSHYTNSYVLKIADDIVGALSREYGEGLYFNLGGAIGSDQWVGSACINQNVKYQLYLPFLPEVQAKYWSKEQKDELARQINKAEGIEIVDTTGQYNVARYHERDRRMVDDADFVVAFWVGKRRGGTFNTMKYALKKSKFVLNALNELRPVFSEDLSNGWTPPTIKGDK